LLWLGLSDVSQLQNVPFCQVDVFERHTAVHYVHLMHEVDCVHDLVVIGESLRLRQRLVVRNQLVHHVKESETVVDVFHHDINCLFGLESTEHMHEVMMHQTVVETKLLSDN